MELALYSMMGDCRTIANAAWTSTIDQTKKEFKSEEDVARVVKMLIKDHHTSPLESVTMTFLYSIDDYDTAKDNNKPLDSYTNLTIHRINPIENKELLEKFNISLQKNCYLITLNFHALIKYKNSHPLFNLMYEEIKKTGKMTPAIEQLEGI